MVRAAADDVAVFDIEPGPGLTLASIRAAPKAAVGLIGEPDMWERICLGLLRWKTMQRFNSRMADSYLVYNNDGTLRNAGELSDRLRREAEKALEFFGPFGELAGKHVVDIGCGDGQKTLVWASRGARSVLGVDIDPARIGRARRAAAETALADRVRFEVAESDGLPSADEAFDVAIMTDVMEHLARPAATLRECRRVLRTGGVVLNLFKTWYSPRGSHLNDWIFVPWNHTLFPEASLIRVLRRMADNNPYIFFHFPALKRSLLPRTLADLADGGLNQMTLHRYRRLIQHSGLAVRVERLTGYGGDSGRRVVRLARHLARVPLLDEFVGGYVVTVLQKCQT
jgi:ubiquinone/menaquinone biosynthesis C-methylase UbiE